MFIKKLTITAFLLFTFFAAFNPSYSQGNGDPGTEIKITLPEFPIVIGDPNNEYGYDKEGYDKEGYDKEGYDRYGYDRYGYDRYGYDRNGYDRKGYNRNGYDRNGYDRYGNYGDKNTYYEKDQSDKKHHDNGKHKGWYKKNKKKYKDNKDDDWNSDPLITIMTGTTTKS